MKAPLCNLVLATLALPLSSFAQTKNTQPVLQAPPANIVIDGDMKEWGDSLRYYNADKKLNYSIANDKDHIYLVVRISDHSEQQRVLGAGLTFSIDPKGKKRDTYSVTFPYTDPEAMAAERMQRQTGGPLQPGDEGDREQLMQARLTKLKQIKATGFADVLNEIITTSNTYGIKTALNIDQNNNYLVYETQVPISMLHADVAGKNEWAFNIRINGIAFKKPEDADRSGAGMGGGRGGMGGGGGRGGGMGGGRRGGGMRGGNGSGNNADRSELARTIDFWDKFYLARY